MGELDPQSTEVTGEEELDSLEDPRSSRLEPLNQKQRLRVPSRSGHGVLAPGRTPARAGLPVLPGKEGMDRRGPSLDSHPRQRVEPPASSAYHQLSAIDNDSVDQNEYDQTGSPDPKTAASSQLPPKNPARSRPTSVPGRHAASNMLRDKSRVHPGAKASSSSASSRQSHSSTSEEDSSAAAQPSRHFPPHGGSSGSPLSRGWKDRQDAQASGSYTPSQAASSSHPSALAEGSEEEDTLDGGGDSDRAAEDTRRRAEATAQIQQTRPTLGHFSLIRNRPFTAHSRNPNRFPRLRGPRIQPSRSPQSTSASKVLTRAPSWPASHTSPGSDVYGDGEDEEPLPATVVNDRTPASSRHPISEGSDTLRRGSQRGASLYRKEPIPENPKAGADVHPGGKSPLSSKAQGFQQSTDEGAPQRPPSSDSRQLSPARPPASRSQPSPGSTVPRRMAPSRSSELSSSQSKDRSLSRPNLSVAHAANSRGVLPSAPQNQNEGSQSSFEDNSTEMEGPDSRAPSHSARTKDTTPPILKPQQTGSQSGNGDNRPQPSHAGASERPVRPGSTHPRASGRAQATPVKKIPPAKHPLPPESQQSVFAEGEEEETEGILKGKEDSLTTSVKKWPSSSSPRDKYADRNLDKDKAAIGLLVQEENTIPGRQAPGSPPKASHSPMRYQPRNPATASPIASTQSWPRYTTRAPSSYSSTTPMLSLRQRMQRRFRTPIARQPPPPRPVLTQGNWFSPSATQPFIFLFKKCLVLGSDGSCF